MVVNNGTLQTLFCRVLFFIVLIAVAPVSTAGISVATDQNPASLNESFQIIFEADGSVDGEPDFSPLNGDFQILSTSQSSNISIVNGDFSSTKRWILNVLARRAGDLTIPPIRFGKDQSPPSAVEVINGYAPGKGGRGQGQNRNQAGDQDIFLEVSAGPLDPYVQSQVTYQVKLYRAVTTSNATLSEPEVSGGNAIIEKVGEDKDTMTTVNGKRYRVTERNYVIYPQASGMMTIEPVHFQARYSTSAFSLFDPFGSQPKSIARQSEPVSLKVRPIPDSYSGSHWLPAKNVNLTEQWSVDPPVFRVGEPITRTLTITANGVTASQLPEIPRWENTGFKQYPDQPVLNDNEYGGGIVGGRQEKTAIIPSQEGEYLLPAIAISWWNTTTDEMEYAELPGRKITVLSAAGDTGSGIVTVKPVPLPELDPSQVITADSGGKEDPENIVTVSGFSGFWKWLSIALGIIWLLTVIGWWWSRRRRQLPDRDGGTDVNMNKVLKELKHACGTNNPRRAKEMLLQWGKLNWPDGPPMSLGETGKRCSPSLAKEIDRLNNALYGKGGDLWEGSPFWQVFTREPPQNGKTDATPKGKLEPLFRI